MGSKYVFIESLVKADFENQCDALVQQGYSLVNVSITGVSLTKYFAAFIINE